MRGATIADRFAGSASVLLHSLGVDEGVESHAFQPWVSRIA